MGGTNSKRSLAKSVKKQNREQSSTLREAQQHFKENAELRLVVFGSGGVGKSALTIRYMKGKFDDTYDPTIEDSYKKDIEIDDNKIRLSVLDTAGQEELLQMKEIYVDRGDGFILVYSVDDRLSFDNLRKFCELISRKRSFNDVPCVFVGNKCDLEQFRTVSKKEGEEFAAYYNKPFFETSALTGENVQNLFSGVSRLLLTRLGVNLRSSTDSTSSSESGTQRLSKISDSSTPTLGRSIDLSPTISRSVSKVPSSENVPASFGKLVTKVPSSENVPSKFAVTKVPSNENVSTTSNLGKSVAKVPSGSSELSKLTTSTANVNNNIINDSSNSDELRRTATFVQKRESNATTTTNNTTIIHKPIPQTITNTRPLLTSLAQGKSSSQLATSTKSSTTTTTTTTTTSPNTSNFRKSIKPGSLDSMVPEQVPEYSQPPPASNLSSIPLDSTLKRNKDRTDSQTAVIENKLAQRHFIPYQEIVRAQKIGEGQFGVVYKAIWREMEVAVKEIKSKDMSESKINEFIREAELMKSIRNHRNVVLLLGVTDSPLSIVTELCESGSLKTLLQSDMELDWRMRVRFVEDIARGMFHLSSESLIHKDLAARNVLVNRHFEAKISDFGMSRLLSEEQNSQYLHNADTGPLKWLAPEAISSRLFSTKSDVWSYGIVMVEVATRRNPYPHIHVAQFYEQWEEEHKQLPHHLDHLSEMPSYVRDIFVQCVQKDANARPDFRQICQLYAMNRTLVDPDQITSTHVPEENPYNAMPSFETDSQHRLSPTPYHMSGAKQSIQYTMLPDPEQK